MLNAYPDSIGQSLVDIVDMLKKPEFENVFSLFYVLPTCFHSDLDQGFSVIDYDRNEEVVLNHLSVDSKQFQDMLEKGDDSAFKNFFVDWNNFWAQHGEISDDGYVVPRDEHLSKLFMRKPGLPILKVRFPDGSDRPYWNTFYQDVKYQELDREDLQHIRGLSNDHTDAIAATVNDAIRATTDLELIDLGAHASCKEEVVAIVERKRTYLGQMDVNARSEAVWDFYDETLAKLRDFGAKMVRLDAFAYLHKEPGQTNFFNKPGTWDYLDRLKRIAAKYDLILLPEIHAEYGRGLHEEVADKGFPIYDFFLPGLVIDALDRGTNAALLGWLREVRDKGIRTINMLGCHDGIPVLDLKGAAGPDGPRTGLLGDEEIDAIIERILSRGGG